MVNWLKASLKGIIKKEQGTCSSFSKCTRDGHLQQNHLRCSLTIQTPGLEFFMENQGFVFSESFTSDSYTHY